MRSPARAVLLLVAACLAACTHFKSTWQSLRPGPNLAGAWRSELQFQNGPFASLKDLQFMYVFNLGGTLTESSNYDGAPPVPPAYGIWRKTGANTYEARYEFYMTQQPDKADELVKSGGYLPLGRGVFTETITLAADGKTFTSRVHYQGLEVSGKVTSADASGNGERMEFEAPSKH